MLKRSRWKRVRCQNHIISGSGIYCMRNAHVSSEIAIHLAFYLPKRLDKLALVCCVFGISDFGLFYGRKDRSREFDSSWSRTR